MKNVNDKRRYACLKCDNLLPVGADFCPKCGEKAVFSIEANLRGAVLAAKEVWNENRPKTPEKEHAVSAELLTVDEKSGTFRTVVRGAVGYCLFGWFGAALGVMTAENRAKEKKATFLVKYSSGRKGVETVKVGSLRFEELAELTDE